MPRALRGEGRRAGRAQPDEIAERRQELFNLRFQSVTGALENSARLKLTKREIARILTVQTERQALAAKTER